MSQPARRLDKKSILGGTRTIVLPYPFWDTDIGVRKASKARVKSFPLLWQISIPHPDIPIVPGLCCIVNETTSGRVAGKVCAEISRRVAGLIECDI
jgi:hypothetical protein